MARPKLETFLTDPKHEEERTFMEGVINAAVDKRVEAIKKKKAEGGGSDDDNVFDTLFDWGKK